MFSLTEWLKKPLDSSSFGLLFLAILCSTYIFYIILVGGDYMAMYRFFVPVLPFIYILLAVSFNLIKKSEQSLSSNPLALIFILIALGGTLLQSTPLEKILFHKPGITHGQYGGVLIEQRQTNRLSLIGTFFNEYKRSKDESLATDAIGAIAFYSNMKIYGLHGLDDPVIAKMKVENMGSGFPGHEKSDLKYILSKEPTYFMFSRELKYKQGDYPDYSSDVDSILSKDYKIVSVWLDDEKNNESGYFTFLQRRDKSNRK